MDVDFMNTIRYIYNDGRMEVRLFLAFGITAVFSPWSIGLTYFLLFLVLYEIYFYCRCDSYPLVERLGLVFASYLGWLFGRYLADETRDEDVMSDVKETIEKVKRILV